MKCLIFTLVALLICSFPLLAQEKKAGDVTSTDMTANLTSKEKQDVKKVMKDIRKMQQADIDKLKLDKRQDLKDEMIKIHKLTIPDYQAAGIN